MPDPAPIESVISVHDYATKQGISDRQALKRIANGELCGYQFRGVWYVRITVDPQPHKDSLHGVPIMEIPTTPVTVLQYSQRTGASVTSILESIANGSIPGFHANGAWYVGVATPVITSKRCRGYFWLQLITGFLLLVLVTTALLWWWMQSNKTSPELVSLSIEVRINDRVGMPQPVVGETFFLLTKDLEDIAIDYIKEVATPNYSPKDAKTNTVPKWVATLAGSTALRSLLFDVSSRHKRVSVWEFRQNFEQSKALWLNHVVRTAVTNKAGQAVFHALPMQEYWIVGWTETSTGLGFWKQWTALKTGANKLSLHPGNTVYFR